MVNAVIHRGPVPWKFGEVEGLKKVGKMLGMCDIWEHYSGHLKIYAAAVIVFCRKFKPQGVRIISSPWWPVCQRISSDTTWTLHLEYVQAKITSILSNLLALFLLHKSLLWVVCEICRNMPILNSYSLLWKFGIFRAWWVANHFSTEFCLVTDWILVLVDDLLLEVSLSILDFSPWLLAWSNITPYSTNKVTCWASMNTFGLLNIEFSWSTCLQR